MVTNYPRLCICSYKLFLFYFTVKQSQNPPIWNEDSAVKEFLVALKLPNLLDTFRRENITVDQCWEVANDDLKGMGVSWFQRRTFLNARKNMIKGK